MRRRSHLAAAARELRPLRQGELDGLCGLYAIINAVRLVLHPRKLRKAELRSLFEAGLRVLSRTRRLRYIIVDGMYDAVFEQMTCAVLDRVKVEQGRELLLADLLVMYDVRTTRAAHRAIRHALHGGFPTLVTLTRSYDHWTVLSAYTNARYTLFDSWGYRWVATENVELEHIDTGRTHGISRALALQQLS